MKTALLQGFSVEASNWSKVDVFTSFCIFRFQIWEEIEHSKVYSARVSGVSKKKYKLFLGFQILCRTLSALLKFGEEPGASCRESIR